MKYTTPYKFASLAGVSTQWVYQLIAKGELQTVSQRMPDGSMKDYIDLEEYPPEKFSRKRK